MEGQTYLNSIIIKYFNSFYEEVLILKAKALNETFFKSTNQKTSSVDSSDESSRNSLIEKIRYRLEKTLKFQASQIARESGEYGAKYFQEAQYAMVALADETFINLPWEGRDEWEDHLLESRFFDTQDAGDLFFQNMDNFLKGRDTSSQDLAVIYLMALGLGFEGKYRDTGSHKILQDYKRRLYGRIMHGNPHALTEFLPLFSEAYQDPITYHSKTFLPDARPWYMTLLFMFSLFLVMSYGLWFTHTKPLNDLVQKFERILN